MDFAGSATVVAASLMLAPLGVGSAEAGECLRVVRPVASGETVVLADVSPTSCEDGVERAFRIDPRWRTLTAVRDLQPGEVLSGAPSSTLAAVRPGDRLFLSIRVGPVTVEREVEAVQAARAGEAVFVRGADGRVFQAPAPEIAP